MYTTAFALALPLLGAFVNAVPTSDEHPNCKGTFPAHDGHPEKNDYAPLRVTCGTWGEKDLDFHWYRVEQYEGHSDKQYAFYNSMRQQICARVDLALNPNKTNASAPFHLQGTVNQYLDFGFDTTQLVYNQTVANGTLPTGNGTLPIILSDGKPGRVSLTIEVPQAVTHSFTYAGCTKMLELFEETDSCCFGEKRSDTLGGTVQVEDGTKYTVKAEARPKDVVQPSPVTTGIMQPSLVPRTQGSEVKVNGLPYKW